jgi:hypothetical protein
MEALEAVLIPGAVLWSILVAFPAAILGAIVVTPLVTLVPDYAAAPARIVCWASMLARLPRPAPRAYRAFE